jgi:SanA protein
METILEKEEIKTSAGESTPPVTPKNSSNEPAPWLKRVISLTMMVVFVLLPFVWYFKANSSSFIKDDGSGLLIQYYNKFFKDWDTFNQMIMIATLVVSTFLFIILDILYGGLFKLIGRKFNIRVLSNYWVLLFPRRILTLLTLVVVFAIWANTYIITKGRARTISSPTEIKEPIPALVLGTSKHFQSGPNKGKENKYFTYRMDAAKSLWEAGKVKEFIVSGDKTGEYDETRDMKEALIALGVPTEKVKIDTSGLRTMDSMLRLRNVFHVNECFIVSQDFHVWRGLFQAYFYGIKGHGYYASGTSTWKMILRECQARPKAVIDLFFLNMMPRDKMSADLTVHHKKFEMNSDKALMLVGTLCIGVICAIAALTKYFD